MEKMSITAGDALSRREFCCGLALGVGSLMLMSCSSVDRAVKKVQREHVFKYPENAGEIADFWDVFAAEDFDADKAINGLKITGAPVSPEGPAGFKTSYPAQNDLVQAVEMVSSGAGKLTEIHIVYSRPVNVSFEDLEANFPTAPRVPGSVGSLYAPARPGAAANIEPPVKMSGTPSSGRQAYAFRAFHTVDHGPTTNGNIILTVPIDTQGPTGTHEVWRVGFVKFP